MTNDSHMFLSFFWYLRLSSKCLGIDCLSVATELNKTCSARARERERETAHGQCTVYPLVN